jgi:hypothetical protein
MNRARARAPTLCWACILLSSERGTQSSHGANSRRSMECGSSGRSRVLRTADRALGARFRNRAFARAVRTRRTSESRCDNRGRWHRAGRRASGVLRSRLGSRTARWTHPPTGLCPEWVAGLGRGGLADRSSHRRAARTGCCGTLRQSQCGDARREDEPARPQRPEAIRRQDHESRSDEPSARRASRCNLRSGETTNRGRQGSRPATHREPAPAFGGRCELVELARPDRRCGECGVRSHACCGWMAPRASRTYRSSRERTAW